MNKKTILYVDDEKDTLNAVQVGLGDKGYDVLIADSGEAALKVLKSNTPDIIIADLRMQPMNGFELFQEVKKIKRLSHIPFFFLTAVDDFLAQKYSQSLGVDAYITKPVDIDTLERYIQSKLEI